jgi:hypothetical protein
MKPLLQRGGAARTAQGHRGGPSAPGAVRGAGASRALPAGLALLGWGLLHLLAASGPALALSAGAAPAVGAPPAARVAGPAGAASAPKPATAPAKAKAKAKSKAGPPTAQASTLSPGAREFSTWLQGSRDNEGAPYLVIDKQQAHLWLFDAKGRLAASTPVLLGSARGDVSVPGIGERPLAAIEPHERTTPAGRFVAEAGRNANGEDIFWVDYDAAVSMHRVRATNPAERRLQRLASTTAADNRISYGCINVPAAFFDQQIVPLFSKSRGVVYLLPEVLPLNKLFRPPPPRRPSP